MDSSEVAKRTVALAAMIVALDQVTKAAATAWLRPDDSREIISRFFNLTHVTNSGAAWGVFNGKNELLAILSLITVLAIVCFRHSLALHPGQSIALALVTGGILGNFLDRIRFGAVVDFLDFHLGHWHWPAFNIADSSICCGVGLYLITTFRAEQAWKTDSPPDSPVSPPKAKP